MQTNKNMRLIVTAQCVAIHMHGDQMYGDRPYSRHLYDVTNLLVNDGANANAEMVAAGWLHDTVEDTALTIEAIDVIFGDGVANLVWAVTGVGKNREERLASVVEKIPTVPGAGRLKLADRLANVRASIREGRKDLFLMYQKEWTILAPVLPSVEECPMRAELDQMMKTGCV